MARDKNFCEKEALNKLTDVFWQKGYNGTSMDDLLQQSNLSRSSLYATYGDKRNLFLLALKGYAEKQDAYLTEWIQKWNSTSEAVDALFRSVIDNEKQNDCSIAKGCFLVNATVEWSTADSEINEIVQKNKASYIKALSKLIKADMQKGIITEVHPPAVIASFIFNNYTGLIVSVKAGASRKELIDIKKMVLEMLGK